MLIRDAVPDEVAALDFDGEPADVERMARFVEMAAAGKAVVLVAEEAGEVLGRVVLDFARLPGTVSLEAFVVAPAHRDRGVGKALMAAAERATLDRGFGEIRVSTGKDNDGALRLYGRLGYERCGEGMSEGLVAADGRVVHEPEPVWWLRRPIGGVDPD